MFNRRGKAEGVTNNNGDVTICPQTDSFFAYTDRIVSTRAVINDVTTNRAGPSGRLFFPFGSKYFFLTGTTNRLDTLEWRYAVS